MKELRLAIKETAPKVEETISYGIPTFELNGRHLVHFAAYKDHIGFFLNQSEFKLSKKIYLPLKQAREPFNFH